MSSPWQEVGTIATLALAVSSTIAAILAFVTLRQQAAAIRRAETFQREAEGRFAALQEGNEAEREALRVEFLAEIRRSHAESMEQQRSILQQDDAKRTKLLEGFGEQVRGGEVERAATVRAQFQALRQNQDAFAAQIAQSLREAEERVSRQLEEQVLRAIRQHAAEHHGAGL